MDCNLFKKGDDITGLSITTGVYLGQVSVDENIFHKVFDSVKQMTIFLPINSAKKLRKLPSKTVVEQGLSVFDKKTLLDVEEIDGSRYKFFKEKLKKTSFKCSIEVLHDLYVLVNEKKISVAERKLFIHLKEKMLHEMSFVLKVSFKDLEKQYLN